MADPKVKEKEPPKEKKAKEKEKPKKGVLFWVGAVAALLLFLIALAVGQATVAKKWPGLLAWVVAKWPGTVIA
jgi:hypothetical protein